MSRRRSRKLAGMSADSMLGWALLLGGVGLGVYLWKSNTPQKPVAGLGCNGADCGCGCK